MPTASSADHPSALVTAAGLASIGAGAIHATAAGAHSEHQAAVVAFALTAVFQIGWGALMLVRPSRAAALLGVAGNAAAVGGWVLAKTNGIGFVAGLDVQEGPEFPDTLAAALAVVAVLGALVVLLPGPFARLSPRRPALVGVSAVAAVALTVPGMVAAGSRATPVATTTATRPPATTTAPPARSRRPATTMAATRRRPWRRRRMTPPSRSIWVASRESRRSSRRRPRT